MSKYISLTARDERLLRALEQYGLLTTRQIQNEVFSGIDQSTVLRRLRKLQKFRLIHKESGLHQEPLVWHLSQKGATALGADVFYGDVNRNLLEHELLLSKIYIHLTNIGAMRALRPGFALRRAFAGKGHFRKEHLIPDAIITVQRKPKLNVSGPVVPVALELELTAKSKARYRVTFRQYAKKRGFNLIWYIVPTKTRGETLLGLWNECRNERTDNRLVWSLTSEILNPPEKIFLHSAVKSVSLADVFVLHTGDKKHSAQRSAHPLGRSKNELQSTQAAQTRDATGKLDTLTNSPPPPIGSDTPGGLRGYPRCQSQ